MAMIPGTEMNNNFRERQNESGYEHALQGEEQQALAEKNRREPVDKIVPGAGYVDEQGRKVNVRESGQHEVEGGINEKPDLQYVRDVSPDGKTIAGLVDKNDPKWTGKEQDFDAIAHKVGDMKFQGTAPEGARPGSNQNHPIKHVGPDGLEHWDMMDKDGNIVKKDIVPPGDAGTWIQLVDMAHPFDPGVLYNSKTRRIGDYNLTPEQGTPQE